MLRILCKSCSYSLSVGIEWQPFKVAIRFCIFSNFKLRFTEKASCKFYQSYFSLRSLFGFKMARRIMEYSITQYFGILWMKLQLIIFPNIFRLKVIEFNNKHFILGDCSSLICADIVSTSHCLTRYQFPHQNVIYVHFFH